MEQRLRGSAVCEAEGHLLLVRLRDPVSHVEALYPPGGGVERGEDPVESARRETLEETGLRVRIDPRVSVIDTYPFRWAGVDRLITTHYFAASLEDPFEPVVRPVLDAEYNLGAVWLPEAEAAAALSVHPAIAAAVARVRRHAKRASWDAHPNVSGPAGTLLGIHDQFRAASRRLVELAGADEKPVWVARAFAPLASVLHHHHHAEEVMLFPLVTRLTGVAPAALVSDHRELTDAIAAVEASAGGEDRARVTAAVRAFDEVLLGHLDREEALVMPVLLELRPSDAWHALHG